jgi:hypothetical protein
VENEELRANVARMCSLIRAAAGVAAELPQGPGVERVQVLIFNAETGVAEFLEKTLAA